MKILVTGAAGQLGSEIRELSSELSDASFTFADSQELDITSERAVKEAFDATSFDYCINCAAYTAVDKAEEDREKADLINITGAENLAKACKAAGAKMFHISTDFVFNGTCFKPLKESDATSPVNYYGLSKLKGEQAVAAQLDEYFIIRTSWLYSSFGNNFVKTMLRLSETKDELNIIADQIGSPTYARDLANYILQLISKNEMHFGLYHFSNEGVASWYDFTKAVFEYKNVKTKVNPIPTEKYPTPASRPHYSVMDKGKFRETFEIDIPHWRESLQECLHKI